MASKEYWFTSRVDLAAQLLDGSRINFSTVQRKKNRETNQFQLPMPIIIANSELANLRESFCVVKLYTCQDGTKCFMDKL